MQINLAAECAAKTGVDLVTQCKLDSDVCPSATGHFFMLVIFYRLTEDFNYSVELNCYHCNYFILPKSFSPCIAKQTYRTICSYHLPLYYLALNFDS